MPSRARPTLFGWLIVLALGACARSPAAFEIPEDTPIVLVSIDTLRADRLPFLGGTVDTPALSRLAAEGVTFTRAYAHTPLTLPSHATLLTGLLPAAHGMRDNVGYRLDRARVEQGELPYLPYTLRGLGYHTCAAVSSFVLDAKSGLDLGFASYDDEIEFRTRRGLGGLQRPGAQTLAAASACLDQAGEQPPFLFLHLYEPHTPYQPPEPFASRYANPYDGEVAAADQIVGELLADLERRGLYERALIIVVSDHGEGLGDHGEIEHGVLLHVEAIHVPLLVRLPGRGLAGTRVNATAGLFDVVPTVLALLGQPLELAPPGGERLPGVPLLSLVGHDAATTEATSRAIYAETFYPRLHFGWSDLASLIDARHHLIDGPAPELYDVVADPRETRNILREERRVYAELSRALGAYSRELVAPAAVDEETRRAMAALGYVGAVGETTGPLPDPKSRLGVLVDLQEGYRLHAQKDYPGAIAALRKVLADSPQMADAWEFLADSLAKAGDREGAIAAYQEALRSSGGAGHVAASLASLLLELGRLEDAEAHARLVEPSQPSLANGLYARIAVERRNFATAERAARAALESSGDRIGPRIVLAEVLQRTGRTEEALQITREAETLYRERRTPDPDLIAGLALLQGKLYADLGDPQAAEAAFRREIELFPDKPAAWSHLALLYALTGRPREVGPTLAAMLDANPGPAGLAEGVRALRLLGNDREAASLLASGLRRFPGDRELAALR
jgi:choline-sulfatase